MPGLKRDTKLLRTMRLLMQMQPDDIEALEATLLEQAKQAWRTALREKGRQYYGRSLTPRDPSGPDLAWMKQMARRDAESIARTYNRAVERQLNNLFAANPRGNRNYYAKALAEWAEKRAAWHATFVSGNVVQRTREYAKDRFLQMNGMRPRGFVLAGPPPVCDECIEADAAGVVDLAYTRRHPMPAHPGCTHEWEEVPGGKAPPLADVWLG